MVDDRFGDSRSGRRLRALAMSGMSDGEDLVNWTRAWTSRDGRYNIVLAARHRDFVVLTTHRLLLWSCGFFSRRPRRKVFDEPLGRLGVEPIGAVSTGAGPTDAGPTDAGPTDAGPTDAGPTDAGPTDAGPTDAGPTDAGPIGAGRPRHLRIRVVSRPPLRFDFGSDGDGREIAAALLGQASED